MSLTKRMFERQQAENSPAAIIARSTGRLRDAEHLVTTTENQVLDFETADLIAGLLSVVRRDLAQLAAAVAPTDTEPPTLTLMLTPQEGSASHA